MRRLFGISLTLALGLAGLSAAPTAADGAIVDQNPSEPGVCHVSADVHGLPTGTLDTDHVLEKWSPSGKANFVCQGTLPEGVSAGPGHSTSGWTCRLRTPWHAFAETDDSSFKANKAGHWTLKCKFTDAVPPPA